MIIRVRLWNDNNTHNNSNNDDNFCENYVSNIHNVYDINCMEQWIEQVKVKLSIEKMFGILHFNGFLMLIFNLRPHKFRKYCFKIK